MRTIIFRVFIFGGAFAIGLAVTVSTSSRFFVARDPAAIRQVYDFSHLRGSALEVAVKERMVAGLEIFKQNGSLGVGLGHFAFTRADGQRSLGCREYGSVELQFEAEGVVVNGERPKMDIEGACEFSEDLVKINPLTVPVARILGEKPADGEFQFRDGKPVMIRFGNLSDEWPRKWVLVGVKMRGAGPEFGVDRNELRRLLGQPLMISFDSSN